MWWNKHKQALLAGAAIIALLALAFWYGGSAAGSRGWTVPARQQAQEQQPEREASARLAEPADDGPGPAADKEPGGSLAAPGLEPEAEAGPAEAGPDPASPAMVIDAETGKDQYQTDPVPEGKPLPVEPQDAIPGSAGLTCTISISCAAILDNLDFCDAEKIELAPADGVILAPVSATFYEGESVFNVLQRTCKQQGIHMAFRNTPIYNSAYIEGIHNLYEFDVGELSGWMYRVNNWFPNYGCSRYQLQDGDIIEWLYTCDLGYDIGGGYAANGEQRDD